MPNPDALRRIAAPLFVLLWSTGFVGAKFGLPHAEPMTFLTLRFALAAAALGLASLAFGEWRRGGGRFDLAGAALVGALIHAVYLGAVFVAIWIGTGAALTALVVGLQPIATAALAGPMLGERLRPPQRLGMALGLGGVAVVVASKLDAGEAPPLGLALCLVALLSISFASIRQKRRGLRRRFAADGAAQFGAAAILTGLAALLFEDRAVDWSPEFLLALGWMAVALSLGAVTLYYLLLRRGAAAETASLFFLVPGVTALMAAAMFGERFGWIDFAGLAIAAAGVRLATAPAQAPASSAAT